MLEEHALRQRLDVAGAAARHTSKDTPVTRFSLNQILTYFRSLTYI